MPPGLEDESQPESDDDLTCALPGGVLSLAFTSGCVARAKTCRAIGVVVVGGRRKLSVHFLPCLEHKTRRKEKKRGFCGCLITEAPTSHSNNEEKLLGLFPRSSIRSLFGCSFGIIFFLTLLVPINHFLSFFISFPPSLHTLFTPLFPFPPFLPLLPPHLPPYLPTFLLPSLSDHNGNPLCVISLINSPSNTLASLLLDNGIITASSPPSLPPSLPPSKRARCCAKR